MPKRLHSYVSNAALSVLRLVKQSEEGELTHFRPGGWWVDCDKVSSKACNELLMWCLIRESSAFEDTTYYTLYDEADQVLADPDYEPVITPHLANMLPSV